MFILTNRDELVLRELSRFRGCLGNQIKVFGSFSNVRPMNRRLKKLIDNGYLERKRHVYGIAGVYRITNKAKKQLGIYLPISEIRLDQLEHDLLIVDVYLYLKETLGLKASDFITEKELRHEEGFNTRTHLPDLVYKHADKLFCVEIELSLKAKERLEKNIKSNYVEYNGQFWYIKYTNSKLKEWLEEFSLYYSDLEIISIEVVQDFSRGNNKT